MSQQELVKRIIGILDTIGIEYMATGSIVSSIQGEPRATHDIDLVIDIRLADVDKFMKAFSDIPDFYLDRTAMESAIERHSAFNLIDSAEGFKVDFWILSGSEFDQSRFLRKNRVQFAGEQLTISSPEDTILAKLRWAKLSGGSEKQFNDALRVYEFQADSLDIGYIDKWARNLGVDELWKKLQNQLSE